MSDLPLFLGRFHPALVHLPIGLLVAAGGLQALAWWRRRRGTETRADATVGPLLGLAAVGAVIAAAAGVLLGTNGGYSGDLFERHRALGLALAASTTLAAGTWLLASRRSERAWGRAYAVFLVGSVCLLVAAGHAGGALTHGEEYLTELAPGWLRAPGATGETAGGDDTPPARRVAFDALVQPVLEKRCGSCHGAESPQGGLRLDTVGGIEAGGDGGGVVTSGRPAASPLWRRVSLPSAHPDAMPPRGRRPVSAAEGALLRWWIAEGASFDATLGELEVPPEVRPIVEALLGPLPLEGPTLPPGSVSGADPTTLASAEAAGFSLRAIAEGVPFLQVTRGAASPGDVDLATLAPLQDQVAWLDLGGTGVGDSALETVGALQNLVRLDLSRTEVSDSGLAHLNALVHLETLNLYGTAVTDAGLVHLEALPRLRRLFLWQTATTAAGVDRLRSALPALEADPGSESSAS